MNSFRYRWSSENSPIRGVLCDCHDKAYCIKGEIQLLCELLCLSFRLLNKVISETIITYSFVIVPRFRNVQTNTARYQRFYVFRKNSRVIAIRLRNRMNKIEWQKPNNV